MSEAPPGPGPGAGPVDGAGAEPPSEHGVELTEPSELSHIAYEEVHAVVEGARLLAFLDRGGGTSSSGVEGASVATGSSVPCGSATSPSGGSAAGHDSAVDVFISFPRRVGRAAALEAAITLRATYMMAYHIDESSKQ
ncbi:hypothetical protein GPECTOR_1g55 [Gonium pectorale]|uniref:Uncharacterized protein n=1 Tax=Gonium pectorale TaxID=33097 RepID=A0A150H4S4_GONPE|nr:hypothetical protein GPECTOR_1g55 [Gonium pectorale]|eukprot:KXZ56610.1 hypothetical protein GPECTOR_1g55 [Gonium pectorale]